MQRREEFLYALSNALLPSDSQRGGGTFGSRQVITTSALGAYSVYAADLDGDGDADVLSASLIDHKIAWYENLAPHFSGSGADLELGIGVNFVYYPNTTYRTAVSGDQVQIACWSPTGTYNFTPPLLVAQAFPTGSTPIGPSLFPEVHIATGAWAAHPAVVIYDGSVVGLSPGLPPAGINMMASIPSGMAPISIMLQGFCLAPNPNNLYFTTTDAQEIRIQ